MSSTTQSAGAEQRFLLHDVRWQTYQTLLSERNGGRYRITYDRGRLEFMTLSPRHERIGELFGRFFVILSEELNLRILSFGSMTLQREDLDRGLEPDKCFYIRSAARVRADEEIDLRRDPPPDLALEIDITHSSLERMSIYAALGVREVWRFDGQTLTAFRLCENGEYEISEQSLAFAALSLQKVAEFVRQRSTTDELALGRSFRDWVRSDVLPLRQSAAERESNL
jgi:Uma2 family endonuclease